MTLQTHAVPSTDDESYEVTKLQERVTLLTSKLASLRQEYPILFDELQETLGHGYVIHGQDKRLDKNIQDTKEYQLSLIEESVKLNTAQIQQLISVTSKLSHGLN